MPKVKYVCLSDLHFGAPSALFTDTPSDASQAVSADPLRSAFANALVATLSIFTKGKPSMDLPGLVLLGDILDFSLGTPRSSIDSFNAFLLSLKAAGAQSLLGPSVFLPGNHDHELWTATRLQNMAGKTLQDDRFVHTTPAFAEPWTQPKAALLDQVLLDNGFAGATTFYPNMGLVSADGQRMIVLHHGHFVESMYRAMSTLTGLLNGTSEFPRSVEDLERLNSSWIDFVWSTDGDNGRLGADIRLGYDYLLTGGEDIRFDQRLARLLAGRLIKQLPIPHTASARQLTEILSGAAVNSLIGQYGQMERLSYFEVLGADALAGLKSYLARPVLTQIARENTGKKPKELTFIFGHTHKPFESRLAMQEIATPPAVYNSGGWDLDMPMFGTKLGAAAVFIDDDLNVASLRLCDVPDQDGAAVSGAKIPGVRVATADGTITGNPLAEQLQAAVTKLQPLWDTFSVAADAAYRTKQQFLLCNLRSQDQRDRKTRRIL